MIVINPGSGPVADATESHAMDNMTHFVADLGLSDKLEWRRMPEHDERGRFCFLLHWKPYRNCNAFHVIDMPGAPLDEVRWRDGLDPWQFPRLYVDGSSWLWGFALLQCDFCTADDES